VHKKETCYELMHSRTPKVSHIHVFGCKCFILKKEKKLDKFEARSVDGIFFGYASHSRAYHVLNLETNQIVETCKVTFDETQPHNQLVFECAGDDELGEEIFQEEEHEHGYDEDGGVVPAAEHVPTVDAKSAPSAKHTASRTSWLHTRKESRDVPVNFSWKLTKDKEVRYQSLELVGWYQTVPYLRLRSQMG
jgi:hypothetical protein